MSTVYSLVCWGGLTGKTVTLTIASPCEATVTNHGLRDGTGLRFKANSDELPTGLTAGVTYYAKNVSANVFNLYSDAELTSVINTSGTQAGTHILQSLFVSDPSNALAAFGLSDLSRWGASGSERVYDSLASWNTAFSSRASPYVDELCELAMPFSEYIGGSLAITGAARTNLIVSKINGIRSGAFHGGVIGEGYSLDCYSGSAVTILALNAARTYADGWSVNNKVDVAHTSLSGASKSEFRNMIVKGYSVSRGTGCYSQTNAISVINSLFTNLNTGFSLFYATQNQAYINCICTKNNTGIQVISVLGSSVINCISVGNTTNWVPGSAGPGANATCNAGLSTDTVCLSAGGKKITMATGDFLDFANNDFRPALTSSPQVEVGADVYESLLVDIAGRVKPAYPGSYYGGYAVAAGGFVVGLAYTIITVGTTDFTAIGASANTLGVSFKASGAGAGNGTASLTAMPDVGCYEYDLGYGEWPASTSVTFAGVNAGSEIRVYDSSGLELAGVEDCVTDQLLSWDIPSPTTVTIRIVNASYRIKEFSLVSAAGSVILPAQQELDKWYLNPP